MNINKKISFTFAEIFIILILSLIFIGVPLIVFAENTDIEYLSKITETGNNLSGLFVPILSFFGSILVYIAFKTQIKANEEIRSQFEQQNFETIYFRLIDSIENRIVNYSLNHEISDELISGYNILPYFQTFILNRSKRTKSRHSSLIIAKYANILDDEDLELIFIEVDRVKYESLEIFKHFLLNATVNERVNFINNDIVARTYNSSWNKLLNKIFDKYFYILPNDFYRDYYSEMTSELFEFYSNFFDAYYRNISMIITHIDSNKNKNFYYQFLNDKMTVQEKILIIAILAKGNFSAQHLARFRESQLLNNLANVQGLKFAPSFNYQAHIDLLLSNEYHNV
jgi:hypothetical protein